MALLGIELSAGILLGANKAVDAKYGPHASVSAANADIGLTLRYKGLTVGILDGSTVNEYWYKDGVTDVDLIFKQNGGASSNNFTGEKVLLDVESDVFPVIPLLSFP
jgi:hypothetical protein